MLLHTPIGKQIDQCMMQYSQKPYFCRCLDGLQAVQLAIQKVQSTEGSNVFLRVSCDDPIITLGKKHQCNCDSKVTCGILKVPMEIWKTNLHKSSQLTCANVLWELRGEEFFLDACHSRAFVVPDYMSKVAFSKHMTLGEVCAGGFGGWAHASYLCCKLGLPIRQGFAVELSREICDVYAKTWQDAKVVEDTLEFFYQNAAFRDGTFFPLFNTDVGLGWWVTCMGGIKIDAGCMSAPCQPFSAASSGRGLNCVDGWVTIASIIALTYLGVKLILLEQVSAIRRHEHWSLILRVFHLAGYRILGEKVVNLNVVSPQNRDRIIVVFIKQHEACKGDLQSLMEFPKLPPFSMKSFGAVQFELGNMAQQTKIDTKALDMYLDHSLLPQREGHKKLKLDLMRYRIRQIHEAFGCIMATYGFQHELPPSTLKNGGLYGNLLQVGHEVRFLAGMECLVLMMPQKRCFIPLDRKLHMKIIGNSICSAHAMLAIGIGVHALELDEDIPSIQSLVLQTIQQRLSFHNSEMQHDDEGWWLQPLGVEVDIPRQMPLISPTINEFQSIEIVFKSGNWILRGIVPRNMPLLDVMKALSFGGQTYVDRVVEGSEKKLVILTQPVVIPIIHMNWHAKNSSYILVMNDDMFCMVPRTQAISVSDCIEVMTAMRVPMIDQKEIVNMCGHLHDASDPCPAIVILVPKGVDKNCRFVHPVNKFEIRSGELAIPMPPSPCRQLIHVLKQRGIGAMCNAFGWSIQVVPLPKRDLFNPLNVVIKRDLKGTVISTDDFRSLLHLWLVQLGMPHDIDIHDIQSTVEVQVKYYGSVYWKGRIHKDSPMNVLMEPWNYLMSRAGDECPIRVVVQGQQVSNETIISTINNRDKMTIYWVLPSWGGVQKMMPDFWQRISWHTSY